MLIPRCSNTRSHLLQLMSRRLVHSLGAALQVRHAVPMSSACAARNLDSEGSGTHVGPNSSLNKAEQAKRHLLS